MPNDDPSEVLQLRPGEPFNPYGLFVGAFIPNALMRTNVISSTAKLVWARLAEYAGRGGDAYPKQETLAAEIGVDERTIRTRIQELVNEGFIEVVHPQGVAKLQHRSCHYKFLWHSAFLAPPDRMSASAPDRTSTSGPVEDLVKRENTPLEGGVLTPARFLRLFNERWEAIYSKPYPRGKNDFSVAGSICKSLEKDANRAKRVLHHYFASTEKFITGHPLDKLMAHLPTFVIDRPESEPVSDVWEERGRECANTLREATGIEEVDPVDMGRVLSGAAKWHKQVVCELTARVNAKRERKEEQKKRTGGTYTETLGDVPDLYLQAVCPAGGAFYKHYYWWMEAQVLLWDGWEGNLRDFQVGKKHWRRFMSSLMRESGLTPRKQELEIFNAAEKSR